MGWPTAYHTVEPVRPIRPPPPSTSALSTLMDLRSREHSMRWANGRRLAAGCGLVVAAAVLSLLVVAYIAVFGSGRASHHPSIEPTPQAERANRPSADRVLRVVLCFDGVVAVLLVPVAVCVRPTSRADVARQVLVGGCRHASADPLISLALGAVFAGLMWGEFMILDAIQSVRVAGRLQHVDRHRAAAVLAMVRADPEGIDPRWLLRTGERPVDLRQTIAYLILNGWANLSGAGDRLALHSGAARCTGHRRGECASQHPRG
jgi:hypothetical protein